jgi:hypothetical protein
MEGQAPWLNHHKAQRIDNRSDDWRAYRLNSDLGKPL